MCVDEQMLVIGGDGIVSNIGNSEIFSDIYTETKTFIYNNV